MKKKTSSPRKLQLAKVKVMTIDGGAGHIFGGSADANGICYPGPLMPLTSTCMAYSDLCPQSTRCPSNLCYSAANYNSQCCV